ncbi:MAG: hypothetical protein JSS49_16390 [Planctomycetes bacterium]|nr:hypothetical protein [Planctomycetota bacterium]
MALPVTPEIQALPPSQQSPAAPVASPPQFDLLTLKEVADELKRNKVSCSLILLNACFAGGVGSNQLAESLEAVALGWPALVADDTAADFAFSFYQRLREGLTPVEAVQQFADTRWTPRAAVEFPVVWLPTPAWVEWKPMPPPVAPVPAPVPAPGAVPTTPSPAVVTIDFQPRPYVNPALLVNFIPALVHLNLKAPSAFIGQTADLCISCDTGSGTSTFRHAVKLSIPTNLVPPENVVFPVLHELVDRRARRRLITFTATVRDTGGRIMDVQTKSTTWMGATEWLNKPEAWKYVPAFVDPLDAGVVSIFEEATRTLRTLGSPQDEFVGYRNTANSVNVRTQLQAIYQTLRDGRERLTYINPPASPLFEGEKAVGQFVRSHSEVVSHRLGSCHDLTLLMAACAEYVGIRPLVILFNGHTFVGFWMTAPAHTNYWAPPKLSPDSWIIDTAKELLRLVIEEAVLVVETTVLGKPERSFDDACNDGFNYLQQREAFMQVAVDVYRARTYGIRPV